ncbi:MAG: PGPGW domain-containing protein [Woeseiaceae bacterium]|nr:PGPGW domain-containing protein [Woeseiaceae bacterium]
MSPLKQSYKLAKRVVIAIIGASVLLVGVIMIVTPGPAMVLIPVGLAILGLEFAWARVWLKRLRESISARNSREQDARAEDHRRRVG